MMSIDNISNVMSLDGIPLVMSNDYRMIDRVDS
jgi:hypothetical protein